MRWSRRRRWSRCADRLSAWPSRASTPNAVCATRVGCRSRWDRGEFMPHFGLGPTGRDGELSEHSPAFKATDATDTGFALHCGLRGARFRVRQAEDGVQAGHPTPTRVNVQQPDLLRMAAADRGAGGGRHRQPFPCRGGRQRLPRPNSMASPSTSARWSRMPAPAASWLVVQVVGITGELSDFSWKIDRASVGTPVPAAAPAAAKAEGRGRRLPGADQSAAISSRKSVTNQSAPALTLSRTTTPP